MNTSSFELLPEPELRVHVCVCVGGGRRREATCVYWYMCRLCVHNYVFMGTFECTCVDISARMSVSVCVWGGWWWGGGTFVFT